MDKSRRIVLDIIDVLENDDYLRAHWYYMSELSRQLRTEHFIKLTQKILDEPKNHYDVTLLIKNEDWHGIDRIIKHTDPRNVAVGSLVSLIRSTYHVRSKLCYWYDLVKNAREIIPLPDIILGIK